MSQTNTFREIEDALLKSSCSSGPRFMKMPIYVDLLEEGSGPNGLSKRDVLLQCVDNGTFTPENFPRIAEFLEGKTILTHENEYTCSLVAKDDEDCLRMVEQQLKRLLYGFDCKNASVDLSTLKLESVEPDTSLQIPWARKVKVTFDAEIRCGESIVKTWDSSNYMSETWVSENNRWKVLWDLLHHGEKLGYRRSNTELYVYKKINNWEDCIEIVGYYAAHSCCNNLVNSFIYLSEFVADKELHDTVKEMCALQNKFNEYGESPFAFLSKGMADINLISLQNEVQRAEKLLDGLRASKDIMERFIERMKIYNPNGIDFRVSLGNWRRFLGVFTVQKIAQDPVLYADDERQELSMVAKKIISGELDVATLPL